MEPNEQQASLVGASTSKKRPQKGRLLPDTLERRAELKKLKAARDKRYKSTQKFKDARKRY